MWRCKTCDSNLLDATAECPICTQPTTAVASVPTDSEPQDVDAGSKLWLWLVMGSLVPPAGILVLLVWIAQKLTLDERTIHPDGKSSSGLPRLP